MPFSRLFSSRSSSRARRGTAAERAVDSNAQIEVGLGVGSPDTAGSVAPPAAASLAVEAERTVAWNSRTPNSGSFVEVARIAAVALEGLPAPEADDECFLEH